MHSFDDREQETQMTSSSMTTRGIRLSTVPVGEMVHIQRMNGGHHFLSRLASLGFTPGASLQVVQNYGRGPIIVNIRDTRVALGRGEACKILVNRHEVQPHGR
jgi:ferrous iron transport protein A